MFNAKYFFSSMTKIFNKEFFNITAFIDKASNRNVSYKDLGQKTINLYKLIKDKCGNNKKKILLFLDLIEDFIPVFYAIIYSENIPVLVNTHLKNELLGLAGHYDFIFTNKNNGEYLKNILKLKNEEIIFLEDLKDDSIIKDPIDKLFEGKDIMLYFFSSDSNGDPKIVPKTFSNIMLEVEYLIQLLRARKKDVYFSLVPAYHIYGLLYGVLVPFNSGGILRINIPTSPIEIIKDGIIPGTHILIGNPELYNILLEFFTNFSYRDFTQLKACISSTMPMDIKLIQDCYKKIKLRILEIYGTTETGGIAFRKYYENPLWTFFPYIKYRTTQLDNILEIISPTISPAVGSQNWYSTEDVIEGNAQFNLIGRVNQVIKMAGNRVSALEIEQVIREIPDVKEIVVVGVKSKDFHKENIVAYVVPINKNDNNLIDKLKKHCQERLAEFKNPKFYQIVDMIPRGENKKILYKKLPQINI